MNLFARRPKSNSLRTSFNASANPNVLRRNALKHLFFLCWHRLASPQAALDEHDQCDNISFNYTAWETLVYRFTR